MLHLSETHIVVLSPSFISDSLQYSTDTVNVYGDTKSYQCVMLAG